MTKKQSGQKKTAPKSAAKKTPAKTAGRKKVSSKPAGRKASGKKGGRRGKQAPETASPLLKGFMWFVLMSGIVLLTGVAVHYVFPPSSEIREPQVPIADAEKPPFEVYPEDGPEPSAPVVMPIPDRLVKLPEVAIIIDDIGYNRRMAEKFTVLDSDITLSILPNSPHKKTIAETAHSKGVQVMLHLPMEPMEYPKVNPGPGVLLTTMSTDDMIRQLDEHLDSVPYVVGVNNHMGSRMTTMSTRMYQIFTILKKRNLFFIDSRTSSQSLCKPSARLLQLPYSERDVFLDHVQTEVFVRKQIQLLIKTAVEKGSAIGIGHPHSVTYEVLRDELPEIRKKVKLVKASTLVHPPGS